MSIAIRQSIGVASGSATVGDVTAWPINTLDGSCLLAILFWRGGTNGAIVVPSGYTLVERVDSGTTIGGAIYAKPNAISMGGLDGWTVTNATKCTLHVLELTGVHATSPAGQNTSTSGTTGTGSTGSITLASIPATPSRIFGGFSFVNTGTLSSLTGNGTTYALSDTARVSTGGSAATKNTSQAFSSTGDATSTGTYNAAITYSLSTNAWVGLIAEIVAAVAGATKTHTADSFRLATTVKTHLTNSLLRATAVKTHSTNTYLVPAVRPHTTNSALFATVVKTHTADSLLRATTIKTHTTGALSYATTVKTHGADSLLFATTIKTHTADSLLFATTIKTHTANTLTVPEPVTWTYVQGTGAVGNSTVQPVATLASSTPAGALVLVGLAYSSTYVMSVFDNRGNTYRRLFNNSAGTIISDLWYSVIRNAGTLTITTVGGANCAMTVDEFSCANTFATDGVNAARAVNTSPASGNVTVSGSDLVYGVVGFSSGAGTITGGAGYTRTYTGAYAAGNLGIAAEYLLNTTTTPATPGFTCSTTPVSGWGMVGVSFRSPSPATNLRVTQEPTRTLVLPTSAKLRITQEPTRTLVLPTSAKLRITQEPVRTLILPAQLTTVVTTHTTDSFRLATPVKTHTTDSFRLVTPVKTHTTGSLLFATPVKTHTTDSLLFATPVKTHTTDSLLFATVTKTHTADSFLRGPTWTYVQGSGAAGNVVTFASPTPVGALVVVGAATRDAQLTSVTDNEGNIYIKVVGNTLGTLIGEVWYSVIRNAGTLTITTSSGTFNATAIDEFSCAETFATDGSAAARASTATAASGNVTVSGNDLVYGTAVIGLNPGTITGGPGYTRTYTRSVGGQYGVAAEYLINTTTTPANPGFTFGATPTSGWAMVGVSFQSPSPATNLRVTQEPVRTLVRPTDTKLRATQESVRTLVRPTNAKIRATQASIRVLRLNAATVIKTHAADSALRAVKTHSTSTFTFAVTPVGIALRASGSVTYDAAANSQVVTIPAGTQTGDLMIASWGAKSASAVLGTPTGWTLIGSLVNNPSGGKLGAFYRIAQAGDTTWTFTVTSGNSTIGIALQTFTGHDPTTPIDVTGTGVQVSSGSLTAGSITIATANAWHLIAYEGNPGAASTATSFTVLSNAAATLEVDLLYNQTPKSTGATGTVSVTGVAGPKTLLPFAIRPAAAAVTTVTKTHTADSLLCATTVKAHTTGTYIRGIDVRPNGSYAFDGYAPGLTKNIPIPAGTQPGDLMVVVFGLARDATALAAGDVDVPAGWTAVHTFVGTTAKIAIWTQYRIAQAGDTSWTWNLAHGTENYVGIILQSFVGVNQITPIDVTGAGQTAAGVTSINVASFTTLTNNAWTVIGVGSFDWTTPGPIFTSAGYAEIDNNAPGGQPVGLLYKIKTPAGATGVTNVASNVGTTTGQLIAASPFAIRPVTGFATVVKTHTTGSFMPATVVKTHTTGSFMPATITKTHSVDSLLRATIVKTHTAGSLLRATTAKVHTTGSFMPATATKTHSVDSLLRATTVKTHATSSFATTLVLKTQTTGSFLRATAIKTHTTGSFMPATIVKTHSANSLLRATKVKTHTTGSVMPATIVKTHSTGSIVPATIVKTHTASTLRFATTIKTHTTGSLLPATTAKTHAIDTLPRATTVKTHAANSFLRATTVRTHTADVLSLATPGKTCIADSLLCATSSKPHAADSLLLATSTVTKGWRLVQKGQYSSLTTTTASISVTLTGVTVGDLLIVSYSAFNFTNGITFTCTDTHSAYTAGLAPNTAGTTHAQAGCYWKIADFAGTITVTLNANQSTLMAMGVTEFSGGSGLTFKVSGAGGGTGTSPVTSSMVFNTGSNCLVWGCETDTGSGATNPGAGFKVGNYTPGVATQYYTQIDEYRLNVPATSSPMAATFSCAGSVPWSASGLVFTQPTTTLYPGTHSTSALRRATPIKTHITDTFTPLLSAKVHNANTLLRATTVRTHTADALKLATAVKTHTTSSFLLATPLRPNVVSSFLRTTVVKTHTASTLKLASTVKTYTTSTLKRATAIKIHTTGSLTPVPATRTYQTSSFLGLRTVSSRSRSQRVGTRTLAFGDQP